MTLGGIDPVDVDFVDSFEVRNSFTASLISQNGGEILKKTIYFKKLYCKSLIWKREFCHAPQLVKLNACL